MFTYACPILTGEAIPLLWPYIAEGLEEVMVKANDTLRGAMLLTTFSTAV